MKLARCFVILVFSLAPLAGYSQTIWTAADGSFDVPSNWSTNSVPGSGDNVSLNSGNAIYTIDVNGTFTNANLRTYGNGVTFNLLSNTYEVLGTVEVNGNFFVVNGGQMISATTLVGSSVGGGELHVEGNSRYTTEFLDVGSHVSSQLFVGSGTSPGFLDTHNVRIESKAKVSNVSSVWNYGMNLTVGQSAVGQLIVEQGLVTSADVAPEIIVGEFAGSFGEVYVQNLGRVNGFVTMDVGLQGIGDLFIQSGGIVSGNNVRIGIFSSSNSSSAIVSGVSGGVGGGVRSRLDVSNLTVGHGTGATLSVDDGAQLESGLAWVGRLAGGIGAVTVTGGSRWLASGDIVVGDAGGGRLTVDSSSVLSGSNLVVAAQSTGSGDVFLHGNTTFSGGVFVGNTGNGSLTISKSLTTQADSSIGTRFGTRQGTVTIDAGGTWAMNSGLLTVQNHGTILVNAGGTLTTAGTEMGARNFGDPSASFVASARVSGNWNSGGTLIIGSTADASLFVENGGHLFSSNARIADVYDFDLLHVDAIVTLQDGSWTNSNFLNVGDGGSGSINVFGNSTLTTSTTTLGSTVTNGNLLSHGIINVSGSNAVWNSNGLMQVGTLGIGEVLVRNQGLVNASEVRISDGAGDAGLIEIDGSGSRLDASGHFKVGSNGTGLLRIRNGGVLNTNQGATIGLGGSGTSEARLTGNSRWDNTGLLIVGGNASGHLNVTDGIVETDTLTAGNASTATGELSISGLLNVNNGPLTIGAAGTGQLSIDGTVNVSSGELRVGTTGTGNGMVQLLSGGILTSLGGLLAGSGGADATVEIGGSGSHWDASGGFLVAGDLGHALVEVFDGATWTTSDLQIASQWRSEVFVEQSTVSNLSLEIGRFGTAQTDLADFYRDPNALGYLFDAENYSGPTPPAHVSGAFGSVLLDESNWTVAGETTVAIEGIGLLGIVNGSLFETNGAVLAEACDSFAHVLVQNSEWKNFGTLEIGPGCEPETGLDGEGILTIDNGLVNAEGAISLGGNSTVNLRSGVLQADSIHIEAGGIVQGYGIIVADSIVGNLIQAPTGTVEFDGNLNIREFQTAVVFSAGTATIGGNISLNNAILVAPNGLIVSESGALRGTGMIEGNVEARGLVSIGASPGLLIIDGDYTQIIDSALLIELEGISGSQYDRLLVQGDVTLAGDLYVSLLNGYLPETTDVFTIITGDNIFGTFDNTPDNRVLFSGGSFQVSYGSSSVQLFSFNAIPEPDTWLLVLTGLATVVLCRRGRNFRAA